VKLDAKRLKDGTWKFIYKEKFDKLPKVVLDSTMTGLSKCFSGNKQLKSGKSTNGWVAVRGNGVKREVLGAMMAGEFMGWSKLGSLTIMELLLTLTRVVPANTHKLTDNDKKLCYEALKKQGRPALGRR
jgi:hypothetical protein